MSHVELWTPKDTWRGTLSYHFIGTASKLAKRHPQLMSVGAHMRHIQSFLHYVHVSFTGWCNRSRMVYYYSTCPRGQWLYPPSFGAALGRLRAIDRICCLVRAKSKLKIAWCTTLYPLPRTRIHHGMPPCTDQMRLACSTTNKKSAFF